MSGTKQPVDKGWAWVVLLCSWLSLFTFSAFGSSAPMIQVEIIEDLNVGAGPVSIMTSCALGLCSLLGPLSGILANLLSVRVTVQLGVVLMSVGLLATSFSHSLSVMIVFYGIVTGVGFGIAFSPIVAVISLYFDKCRMLANGILMCASGVGFLCIPYFTRYVIDERGWRFTLALLSALILHVIVFASVFFPTDVERQTMIKFSSLCCWRKRETAEVEEEEEEEEEVEVVVDEGENGEKKNVEVKMKDGRVMSWTEVLGSNGHVDSNGVFSSKSEKLILRSNEEFVENKLNSRKLADPLLRLKLTDSAHSFKSKPFPLGSGNGGIKGYVPVYVNGTPEARKRLGYTGSHLEIPTHQSPTSPLYLTLDGHEAELGLPPSFRDRTVSLLSNQSTLSTDTFATAQLSPPPMKMFKFGQLRKGGMNSIGSSIGWASAGLGSSIMLPVQIEELKDAEEETTPEPPLSLKDRLRRISRNKAIWVMCLNNVLFTVGCGMHSVHFPSFAASMGINPQQVAQFYTMYGATVMSARILGGFMFNRFKPPLAGLLFCLQTVNGLSLALAPIYARTPAGIFILQGLIGTAYGQSYMIVAPLTAQLVGVADLTIAFGIIMFFSGIGYIVSPVLAGFVYDVTNTFAIPYYIAGSAVVVGALCLFLMRCLDIPAPDLKQGEKEEQEGEGEEEDEEKRKEEDPDKRTAGL